jgi:hypothetical protein
MNSRPEVATDTVKFSPPSKPQITQLTRAGDPSPAVELPVGLRGLGGLLSSLTKESGTMVLREERAATNVKRAMNDAGVQFQLKGLERMVEGYVATFQRMVTHVESQIDERSSRHYRR